MVAGTGWTPRVSSTADSMTEDRIDPAFGLFTPTMTSNNNGTWFMAAIALKSANPANYAVLNTISLRPATGTLLNEYALSPTQQYRYYRYVMSSTHESHGGIADLDFIGQYTAGVNAATVTPTISPPAGNSDQPTNIPFSSITTDALIYYTLDGTTPTLGSNRLRKASRF